MLAEIVNEKSWAMGQIPELFKSVLRLDRVEMSVQLPSSQVLNIFLKAFKGFGHALFCLLAGEARG